MKAQEVYDRLSACVPGAQIVISAQSLYDLLANVNPDFEIKMEAGNGPRITMPDLARSGR
jgi:hypothetical protein